jgi:hypothetical protein
LGTVHGKPAAILNVTPEESSILNQLIKLIDYAIG